MKNCDISVLLGKTLKSMTIIYGEYGEHAILFELDTGEKFRMYDIEDIVGDIEDLIGCPLITVEKTVTKFDPDDEWGSYKFVFYKFETIKGVVEIFWYDSAFVLEEIRN